MQNVLVGYSKSLYATWFYYKPARLLLDAGEGIVHVLGKRIFGIRKVFLSHGHEDHVGAATTLLERAGRPLLIAHPAAFESPRYWREDDGTLLRIPQALRRDDLSRRGVEILESAGPTTIAGGAFLVTGEIPRETAFEHALPGSMREENGDLVPDHVVDDQAVVVRVRDCGLVVITGCAHAGVVNTVRCAQDLAGSRRLCAVVGGFHLSGTAFRDAIAPTIQALRKETPTRIVPMHCTGVDATARLRMAFGDRCCTSAVGTRLHFPF